MGPDATIAEVRRHLAAPPERVFGAFADALLVSQWLSPAPEIELTVLRFDFRVGGAYRFAYAVPGGPVMHVNGVFRHIAPPSRLVFSWIIEPPDEHAGIESEVTATITPHDGGAELFIRHEKLGRVDAIERHAQGWQGAFDRLTVLLAEGSHG